MFKKKKKNVYIVYLYFSIFVGIKGFVLYTFVRYIYMFISADPGTAIPWYCGKTPHPPRLLSQKYGPLLLCTCFGNTSTYLHIYITLKEHANLIDCFVSKLLRCHQFRFFLESASESVSVLSSTLGFGHFLPESIGPG